jgi:hypothetical protein
MSRHTANNLWRLSNSGIAGQYFLELPALYGTRLEVLHNHIVTGCG